jgi:hypothetical protein
VVKVGDEERKRGVGIGGRRGDGSEDGIEKGSHASSFDFWGEVAVPLESGVAFFGRNVNGGEVELGVGGVELEKEFKDLIENFLGIGIFAIDLIKNNDGFGADFEGFAENELGLGLRTLGSINDKENAIDHAEDAFDFSTEIGVAWGIDNVDADIVIFEGGVFGFDGNTPFPLEVHRVHHALGDDLVGAESTCLAEELIHESGLAVIDVGNDCNISEF